ncbi:uncharacterized protein DUF4365 [Nonomuraea fuscirosea]|uniref:Uncharacterized protein DUF4365 n=1 Tax=Nonomuraea fuscirosea TaxID=1291556 RepID=A0A2T0MPB6_9ACTN|nr:DUF4365 domain-containing protein [Nonomuraea fuscirosea]PRX59862.1 uncharacterized protein DUF4365 [Nonomuraea fuscirosea]
MPPTRPRSHKLASLAVGHVTGVFQAKNWIVEEIRNDYGEDLQVRIVEDDKVTPYAFYVQVKGTDSLDRYLDKAAKHIKYPFEAWRLKHWMDFWEPVVITIWDSQTNLAYWEIAQIPDIPIKASAKSPRIAIPIENKLDIEGLARIKSRTIRRHQRFENEQQGAQVLLERLEELLGIDISYDPQGGVLIVENPEGGATLTFFGKFLEEIEASSRQQQKDIDVMVHDAIISGMALIDPLTKGEELVITDKNSGAIQRFTNIKDLFRYWDRKFEIGEHQ